MWYHLLLDKRFNGLARDLPRLNIQYYLCALPTGTYRSSWSFFDRLNLTKVTEPSQLIHETQVF